MTLKIVIISLILFSFAHAEDSKVPCRYKDGSLGLRAMSSFDCKLSEKISSEPKLKAEFKEHLEKKLAEKVAKKAADVIEDIALLDSYFDNNGIELGENQDVRDSCQLQKIAQPVCNNVSPNQVKQRLKNILGSSKFLPESSDDNSSLYKRMIAKAEEVRSGHKLKDVNNCPLKGSSGYFILNAQFTHKNAKMIINDILKGQNGTLTFIYKSYPQLGLLVNDNNDSLKKKFESEMLSFKGEEGSEKKFIDEFFKRKDVQAEMATSLSGKCNNLAENVKRYVCEKDNLPHLAMRNSEREVYLDDSEDEVFKEVSRGLSCSMEEKFPEDAPDDPFKAKGNITEKMDFYSKELRGPEPDEKIEKPLELFCSAYSCKDEKYKKMNSCKNGGPVSSLDIIQTCKGAVVEGCEDVVQTYISYLILMENDAKNSGVAINGLASSSKDSNLPDGSSQKPRGFSSFYQNFLGVEGTIAAEGKKITPTTIAEKKAEFVEKKLDVSTNAASLSQSREGMKVESVRQESVTPVIEDTGTIDTASTSKESDQFRRSFQSTQFSKANYELGKDANGKTKKVKFTDTESSTLDEMKKLRGELADALGKVKGTDEERLATIADGNAVAITPKGSSINPIKNLSSAEKDRLDSYRDSLDNWEDRLRSWQNSLSDRDVRANSGTGSTSDARPVTAPAINDDQFKADNESAGGARLTKSSAGASGVAGAKGDVTGERAPGTEKVEGEAGVVNSENLATLGKESLKELGITATDSFIIKVRHKEKIYSVPVKTLTHDGKSMFVPLLNEKDPELSKIVYESPLFKDYRAYQIERQYKLENK